MKNVGSNEIRTCGLESSTGRVADRYPEGAKSNLARVNTFQLTSALSDYHENFLLMDLSKSSDFHSGDM